MQEPKILDTNQLEGILEWDINNCNAVTVYGWSKKKVRAYVEACEKELYQRGLDAAWK